MKTLIPTLMTAIILTACTSPAEKPQQSPSSVSAEFGGEMVCGFFRQIHRKRFGGQNGFFGFEQNAQGAWQDGL